MKVRDQYSIDAIEDLRSDRARVAEMQEAGTKERIGQEPHAVHIDENCRMPGVDDSGASDCHELAIVRFASCPRASYTRRTWAWF